jgi:outer membrane protein assembly factor BamE (lipoprotein component of BamABCDE complex)
MDRANAKVRWSVGRSVKYVAIAGLAAFAVLLFAVFVWWTSGGVFMINSFDQKTWSATPSEEGKLTCYRGHMADDIKTRLLKPGIPRADVEYLLGLPDDPSNPQEYQYLLGVCTHGIDEDYLHIYFDAERRVERAAIIPH